MEAEFHVFGGQGWPGLFEEQSVSVARHDAHSSAYARKLLRDSHQSLVKDLTSIYLHDPEKLCAVLAAFSTPESLLAPPESYHKEPWVQGMTLCIFQLLRFLAQALRDSSYQERIARVRGTAGLCSGILPAVVVASSPTIDDFVERGVQAFRAAFWIGYHAAVHSRRLLRAGESLGDGPWTYNVSGIRERQLLELITDFNSEAPTSRGLRLGAILHESSFNVVGASRSLQTFLTRLPASGTARPVCVNALYHGGKQLDRLVGVILQDFEAVNVILPSYEDLCTSFVLSPDTGSRLSADSSSSISLARYILELILIKPVNWPSVVSSLKNESGAQTAFTYGPASNLLVPSMLVSGGLEKRDVSHDNIDVQLQANYSTSDEDIAIVGVGLDFPNGSSLDVFWESLESGMNFVSAAPGGRFPAEKPSATPTPTHGNFISDLWSFDRALFSISPREAKVMDPQQRILLHCAFHALQHAGYVPDTTATCQRETFGCYVGVATGDYEDRMRDTKDVYYSPGTLRAFLSGRISYCFGLSGPSVVIDTACSGSLVAIHQACRALIAKECNAALAGGVNAICGPDMQKGLARARFLSPGGQCRPFDAEADGYCRSEGGAMFVLKRMKDALAENDRILGIIKATGVNQSGNADSITHPHADTQKDLFRKTLGRLNILPQSITAIEAHGTGTQAGDPIEFESISRVFGSKRSASNPVIISSIKGNIGHAEAASGAAGLAKLMQMMRRGRVPPQVGLQTLNPKVAALMNESIIIPRSLMEWPRVKDRPRRALLNNFGAAGSNACLVLEEYMAVDSRSHEPETQNSAYIFVLTGKDVVSLGRYQGSLLQDAGLRKMRLCDLSYTSTARRELLETRLVLKASSTDQLFQSLEAYKGIPPPATISPTQQHKVVFVFSGQGSQYMGMGRELFETVPKFRDDVLMCDNYLLALGHSSFMPLIHGEKSTSLDSYGMLALHCATFAIEYALARLYMSWGVRPTAVLGHSLGEYASFVIAGVLSVEDALFTLARRATLVEDMCEQGTTSMLSVAAGKDAVEKFLSGIEDSSLVADVHIACDNSPEQCVLSGRSEAIDAVVQLMTQTTRFRHKKLPVNFGYHSPAMKPIRLPLNDAIQNIRLREPVLPVGVGLLGRMHRTNDITHEYFSAQAVAHFRFREVVEDLSERRGDSPKDCQTLYLEIGPHPVVLPMMKSMVTEPAPVYMGSLRRDMQGWDAMCDSLSALVRTGFNVNFSKVYEDQDVRVVDLPLYPFFKEEFVIPFEDPVVHSQSTATSIPVSPVGSGPFLASKAPRLSASSESRVYEASQAIEKFIDGHRVAGSAICPASVYTELALQAAQESPLHRTSDMIELRDVTFSSPLVRSSQAHPSSARVAISQETDQGGGVSFLIYSESGAAEHSHCQGVLQYVECEDEGISMQECIDKSKLGTPPGRGAVPGQLIKKKMLYEMIFTRVVSYSELYQTLDYLEISDDLQSAWGSFRLRQNALLPGGVSQPVFVDTLLHAAGFMSNSFVGADEVCICAAIDSISFSTEAVDFKESFTLYTEITTSPKSIVGSSYAFDCEGRLAGMIKGIVFRRLSKNGFTRSLERMANISPVKAVSEFRTPADRDSVVAPEKRKTPKDDVKAAIFSAIAEAAGLAKNDVQGGTGLKQLGLDSFMMFELLDLLKSRFRIEIPQVELEKCETAGDVASLVEADVLAVDHDSGIATPVTTDPTTPELGGGLTGNAIHSAIAEVAGLDRGSIKDETDLKHLGLDSFMMFELLDLLKLRFNIEIAHSDLETCETAGDIALLVSPESPSLEDAVSPCPSPEAAPSRCLSLIRKGAAGASTMPVYFVHDGSGVCSMYSALGDLGRDVFGISSDKDTVYRRLEDMAAGYAALIDATEPFVLGGWSFGGVVAHEMARILHDKHGAQVRGVIMVDSPCPTHHEGIPQAVLRHLLEGKSERLLGNFERHSALLAAFSPSAWRDQQGAEYPVILLKSKEAMSDEDLGGDATCGFLVDGIERQQLAGRWAKLVGSEERFHELEIPGNHFEPFTAAHAPTTARAISKALAAIEKESR